MPERFVVESTSDSFWPGEVLALEDREAGSRAQVVPALGANLVSFGARIGGEPVESFLQPGDETPPRAPDQYGAPVLFPFPNRLRDGQAYFGGRTIAIDRAPGQRHAIHGLVRQRAWRIARTSADAESATVQCVVESDRDTLRQFPFPFWLSLTFRLVGPSLRVEIDAENRGNEPMPMGFGWHPYFRLPLLPTSDRRTAIVQIPAGQLWELEETLVPTGRIVPVPAERDFRRPRALGALHLDDVYTGVEPIDQSSTCMLRDAATGASLRVVAGPTFREWVVYAPPTRPTICFEPYTCPTDAFNLAARGLDVGLIVLPPGGHWSDWIELSLRSG